MDLQRNPIRTLLRIQQQVPQLTNKDLRMRVKKSLQIDL
jgi:hypothetical protein